MNEAGILMVDDSKLDIELALDAFREAGISTPIHVATGGRAALDYLLGKGEWADRTQHPLPALVVLDLKMPEIDGFEVLRQIKAAPHVRRIPVVILSSSREEEDLARSYDGGANSYITKPSSFKGFGEVAACIHHYWLTLNTAPDLSRI